jgi:hypothetical protein
MDERMQFVARRLAGEAMAELCREFGISRKTGYKIFDRTHRKKLGPTWGQNMGLLGPKPCASCGTGNGLNGTFGRGGGDRTYQPAFSVQHP